MQCQHRCDQKILEHCAAAADGGLRVERVAAAPRLQEALLGWYRAHCRTLPWRGSQSAYRIFLAEMMLQQTQVERVIPKYHDFLAQYPTIRRLAAAPLAEVIRLWAGLGYNRRAVHLHRAAQAVVREHGGRIPMSLKTLLELPGIGAYTARALLSFAANAPVAVVDTNVRRVLGRVFQHDLTAHFGDMGPTARQFQALADSLVPAERSARWNQALMDLGSAICTARQPDCNRCPFFAWCQARREGEVIDLPSLRPRGQGKFAGSKRYYRGRIIAALRERPPGSAIPFFALVDRVQDRGAKELPASWLWELTRDLERDGLVAIAGDRQDQARANVMLPT